MEEKREETGDSCTCGASSRSSFRRASPERSFCTPASLCDPSPLLHGPIEQPPSFSEEALKLQYILKDQQQGFT